MSNAATTNRAMLEFVAKALGDLKNECTFVGGTVTCFYMNSSLSSEPRPTEDVDCIVQLN